MTTPNELEIALQDFISECDRHEENCDDCTYRELCTRFVTPHRDCPNEWMILEKSGGIPC